MEGHEVRPGRMDPGQMGRTHVRRAEHLSGLQAAR